MKARAPHEFGSHEVRKGSQPVKPFRRDANVFVGKVEEFSGGIARGWAWTPRRPGYACVMHVLDEARIVAAGLVLRPEDPRLMLVGESYRFEFDLSDIEAGRLARLQFVIGESRQKIPVSYAAQISMAGRAERKEFITVEDLVGARSLRPSVRGATYYDAIEAGILPSEIVDLFYQDYLGRDADEAGLAHYCTRLNRGAMNYDEVRADLLGSTEFSERLHLLGELVGGIFSEDLIYAPIRRLPWDKARLGAIEVPARSFWALWGSKFVELAHERVCRTPLAGGTRSWAMDMLNGASTKFDIVERFEEMANVFSQVVAVEDIESLKALPARRHHEIPLRLLLQPIDDREFITTAYQLILGEDLNADAVEEVLINLESSVRMEAVLDIVHNAHQKGIPAVVSYDNVLARKLVEGNREDQFEIILDDGAAGYGWHDVEREREGAFRWMGASSGVIVPALAQEGGFTVSVTGPSYVHRRAVETFHCSINGVRLNGRAQIQGGGGWSFTSEPANAREFDTCYPYVVEFSVADRNIPQHPRDSRFLTLAVAAVTIRRANLDSEDARRNLGSANRDAPARDLDGYPLPLPCLVPADVLKVPSAFNFGGKSRLRHGSKIVFESVEHDDVDEPCIFFGPYVSLSPGAYSAKLNGTVDGEVRIRITADKGLICVFEHIVTSFDEALPLSLATAVDYFEVVAYRVAGTRSVTLHSLQLELIGPPGDPETGQDEEISPGLQ